MLWVYFDASALVKRYSHETGTVLVNEVFSRLPLNRMTCSVIGVLEIASILTRKRNDGRLSEALFNAAMLELKAEIIDHDEFVAASLNDDWLDSALPLVVKHNLNATDAVILRSALDLQLALQENDDDLLLWTSDKRLARAAQNEGLNVFDPETETAAHLHELLGPS